jgi:hypothetical protein
LITPPRHILRKISVGVDGGLNGGSRAEIEDPHGTSGFFFKYMLTYKLKYILKVLYILNLAPNHTLTAKPSYSSTILKLGQIYSAYNRLLFLGDIYEKIDLTLVHKQVVSFILISEVEVVLYNW